MSECKKCGQSWRPPKDIIYKEGFCIPCYFIEYDFLEQKKLSLKKYLVQQSL